MGREENSGSKAGSLERKSARLAGYDYSLPGAYFITICSYHRRSLFSRISGDLMALNQAGRIVESCWRELPEHCGLVAVDEFCVMPNHVHESNVNHPYDHIVRSERSLEPIRPYIATNSQRWDLDKENPNGKKGSESHV